MVRAKAYTYHKNCNTRNIVNVDCKIDGETGWDNVWQEVTRTRHDIM